MSNLNNVEKNMSYVWKKVLLVDDTLQDSKQ